MPVGNSIGYYSIIYIVLDVFPTFYTINFKQRGNFVLHSGMVVIGVQSLSVAH